MHIQNMPKGHRPSRSQGYYRVSPVLTTNGIPSQYQTNRANNTQHTPSQSQMNNSYYPSPLDNMSQQNQPQQNYNNNNAYATGGPVQHPSLQPLYSHSHSQSQSQAPLSLPTPPPVSLRPSSGAWTPHDDAQLMSARSSGMNWLPIQQAYFPTKSANACRKRHERLMERRNADDWDGVKLEVLAKTYMTMRREIWQPLADLTGEKWSVVESKCMSQGLKNLQTHARSHARRERLLDTHSSSSSHPASSSNPHSHSSSLPTNSLPYSNYPTSQHLTNLDDPNNLNISLDDLDDSYDQDHDQDHANGTDGASDRSRSVGSVYGGGQGYVGHSHSHSSSTGSGGSRGGGVGGWGVGQGMMGNGGLNGLGHAGLNGNVNGGGGSGGNGMGHGRLPSLSDNMGIESIINRTTAR